MSEQNVLFADRLMNIAVTGALVRLQWGALGAPQGEGASPQLQATQTLVLPLEGLLASMGMVDGLLKQLVKDGVITPQQPNTVNPTN